MKQVHTLRRFLILCTSPVLLYSCNGYFYPPDPYLVAPDRQNQNVYYSPTTPNAPLLSGKGSFSMGGHYGGNRELHGGDIHLAFMPGRKLGFMVNYRGAGYNEKLYSTLNGSFTGIEFGMGYVLPARGMMHFETYAGIGTLSVKNEHHTGLSKMRILHYFIQPALSIGDNKKRFQFAIVPRISINNFSKKFTSFDKDRELLVADQIRMAERNNPQIILDPSFIIRAGSDALKFQLAYTFSKNLTLKNLNQSGRNISLGLIFSPVTSH